MPFYGEYVSSAAYSVTNALTHVISNNSTTEGSGGYAALLVPNDGYENLSVEVTMGGVDVTEAYYDGWVISIPYVEDALVITASATAINYAVTNTLTRATSNNAASTAAYGSSYSATITADNGYALDDVMVAMGGVDITSTSYSNGAISISSVTGAILISATTVQSYSVTNLLTNATNSNSATFVGYEAAYSATISADVGYVLDAITVTMGGTDITATAVMGNSISIASVIGSIVITVTTLSSGVIVTDSFDRANSTTNVGSADTGQAWQVVSGAWGISSNRAYVSTAVEANIILQDMGSGSYDISCDVEFYTSRNGGLVVRGQDANNWITLTVKNTGLSLERKVSGAWAAIGSYSFTPSNGATHTIRAVVTPTQITCYMDGTQRLNYSNSDLNTLTKTGLVQHSTTTGIYFNNFSAGTT